MTLAQLDLLPPVDRGWEVVTKGDVRAVSLADGHYSRRKPGSPQFMPPGETLVLWRPGAVFGWWRPHPRSGIRALNGLDGWTCTIFRRVGGGGRLRADPRCRAGADDVAERRGPVRSGRTHHLRLAGQDPIREPRVLFQESRVDEDGRVRRRKEGSAPEAVVSRRENT